VTLQGNERVRKIIVITKIDTSSAIAMHNFIVSEIT